MESKGAVNCYKYNKYDGVLLITKTRYTINLAIGTTPFMVAFDGLMFQSQYYNVHSGSNGGSSVIVTHCWYRPSRAEFAGLNETDQKHVMLGGLLKEELGKAITLENDPITDDMSLADFNKTMKELYQ